MKKIKKFNVVLEETIKRQTTVVVEVESEEQLEEILDIVDGMSNDNSEDYISDLGERLSIVEIVGDDGEIKEFECTDYYKYKENF